MTETAPPPAPLDPTPAAPPLAAPRAVAARQGTDRRRTLRTAGTSALVPAVAYLGQPLVVAVLAGGEDTDTVAFVAAHRWVGSAEALVFTVVGAAFAVLVLAVDRLRTGTDDVLARRAVAAAGLASALGWLLCAGTSVARYSPVATGLADGTMTTQDQGAVLASLDLVTTGAVGLSAVAGALWLGGVAVTSRRALGTPSVVVLGLGAAAVGVPLLVLAVPFGVLALIPVLLVVGVAQLVRARRA